MNNIVSNFKNTCRICLTQNGTMMSLCSKLDDKCEDGPRILDAFENLFSIKVNSKEMYPEQVCKMCFGNIKISHDLKLIFFKSQKIIEKYVSLTNAKIDSKEEDKFTKNKCSMFMDLPEIKEECFLFDSDDCEPQCNESFLKYRHYDTSVCVNNFVLKEKKTESKMEILHKENDTKKLPNNLSPSKQNLQCKYSLVVNKEYKKNKSEDMVLECKVCNKFFKNKKALLYHRTTQHNDQEPKYVCNVCGKRFYLKNSLSRHMDTHNRDVSKVVCPVCGKHFHYRGGLFYHLKIHRNERNYKCEYCDRKFLNLSGLKKHIRIHTGEKPFACSYCGKTFISKNILDNHEKTHTGIKTKICPYCSKGFITTYCLKIHMSSHRGSLPCNYCKRTFLNVDVIKLHMKFKHRIDNK